jgi:carbamoyl-phosphate synthase large subunit
VSSSASRPLTVLVLGVGGNVSQGILKALAASTLRCRVVAACVSPLSPGLYRADRSLISPLARDAEFLPWLTDVCRDEGVDAVLSGVEPVLTAMARGASELREETGAVCLVSPPEVLEVGDDKLRTASWLEEQGLASPRSADAADEEAIARLVEACGLPVVVKPRVGKGAESVAVARTEEELSLAIGRHGYLVQELLEGDEYTVGCMCDEGGELRGALAMRRTLAAGTTYRAEAGSFPEVRREAEAIAGALRPAGPLNVQLRLDGGRPVAFELNIRFSGTTPIRARLGFNEVEAALRHFVLGEPIRLPEVTSGVALRYWNEVYVPPEALEALERSGRLEDPWSYPALVEDWGVSR